LVDEVDLYQGALPRRAACTDSGAKINGHLGYFDPAVKTFAKV